MFIDKRFVLVLEVMTCLFLALCLALAITAQATPWWIFDSTIDENTYSFGLYRFCSKIGGTETCYRFSKVGMEQLKLDLKLQSIPDAETFEGRTIWILSFIAILCNGLSFLISIGILNYGCKGKLMDTVFIVQSCLTLVSGALGIASVIRAYDFREEVWRSGGVLLYAKGLANWVPSSKDVGFNAQTACYTIIWITVIFNVVLYFVTKKIKDFKLLEANQKQRKR